MGEAVIVRRPSDIGLKDLEIFYNPELLLGDLNEGEYTKSHFLKKTLITGAVIIALNTSAENFQEGKIKILNKPTETTYVVNAVNIIEEAKECIVSEVNLIINKERVTHFTDDEISEMEILDAYNDQIKKFYPPKNKIPF